MNMKKPLTVLLTAGCVAGVAIAGTVELKNGRDFAFGELPETPRHSDGFTSAYDRGGNRRNCGRSGLIGRRLDLSDQFAASLFQGHCRNAVAP